MNPEESMFQEARTALADGDRERARDLLARLLKIQPGKADYWLWMSATVNTSKERIFCLNEALRIDPKNSMARRGLILEGQLPPEKNLSIPLHTFYKNWKSPQIAEDTAANRRSALMRMGFAAGGLILIAALIAVGLFGTRWLRRSFLSFLFAPTPGLKFPTVSEQFSATLEVTASPTSDIPTPPWAALKATYTPTAVYINTPHPRSEAYRAALRAKQDGKWDEAITYFQQAADLEPDAPDLQYHIADAYLQQGNLDQAIHRFSALIGSSPNFAPAYYGRARARMQQSSPRMANVRQDLTTALQLDGQFVDAALELASLELTDNKTDAALQVLDAFSVQAQESTRFHLLRAAALLQAQRPADALPEARRANQLDLTELAAYRLIAQAALQLNEPQEAVNALQAYTQANSQDIEALKWLGQAHQALGQTDKAIDAYTRSLSIDGRQFDALYQRALLLLETDQKEKAAADLNAALTYVPRTFDAYASLGIALFQAEVPGNAYQQLSVAEGLASDGAQKAVVYYWRAQCLEQLDKETAALRDWQSLAALPAGQVQPEWLEMAAKRIAAIITPTRTPVTPTSTQTRWPTRTSTPQPGQKTTASPALTLSPNLSTTP